MLHRAAALSHNEQSLFLLIRANPAIMLITSSHYNVTLIITLILIGTAAILLELFLPGGIVGAVGGLCLLGAAIATFNQYGFNAGLLVTLGILLSTCIALFFWMKNFERLPGMKRFILTESVGKSPETDEQQSLLNKTGKTLTDLGPSGKALIEGKKLDVIAQSGYIDEGTPVMVVEADGSKTIVRPVGD